MRPYREHAYTQLDKCQIEESHDKILWYHDWGVAAWDDGCSAIQWAPSVTLLEQCWV